MSYRVQPYQHRRPPCRKSLKQQQGVVIVVALLIVALVASMSYFIMSRLMRDINRTTLIFRDTQAEWYAQGSLAWAKDQLRQNWEKQKTGQPVDVLPMTSPINKQQGYTISSTIYDMQARFNINNVNDADSQDAFKRLLQAVAPTLSAEKAKQIVAAVVDWISPGSRANTFADYYSHLPSPYRAAHRPLFMVSELLLVKGMTPALFTALQPYITALPAGTAINVQTAPAPVLVTLSKTLNLTAAKAIAQWRLTQVISAVSVFLNGDLVRNHAISDKMITVVSEYFLIETQVVIEKQHVVLYTLLQRQNQSGKVAFNIVWQSKGME